MSPEENRQMVRRLAGITDARVPICIVRLSLDKPYHLAGTTRSDRLVYVGSAWLAVRRIDEEDMSKNGKPRTCDRDSIDWYKVVWSDEG
jgi:hypothetical protein